MPNLIETYARSTGLQIDKPWLKEDYFPLPFERYITLATGSGQAAKNYSYYQDVVNILSAHLAKEGLTIILLGSKDDPALQGVYDLRGRTSFAQSYYLIKRAVMHLGNDTWTAHAAGWANVPLVALYGSTDTYLHGPHWRSDRTILLESHRRGNKPSFGQEPQKTVDFIDPFAVARSVLQILGLEVVLTSQTQFIGQAYQGVVLDYIPNLPLNPGFNPEAPCAVRMDLEHNEQNLIQVLQSGRKVNVVTKAPINLDILRAFKGSILSYNHEVDETCSVPYLKEINKLGINYVFFSRTNDLEKLASLRAIYFGVIVVQHIVNKTKADFEKSAAEYLNIPTFSLDTADKLSTMRFKTNKFVLSRGKIYLSLAHEKADLPIVENNSVASVIDDLLFWQDQAHMLVFKE